MENFNSKKYRISDELDKFIDQLNSVLPQYSDLLRKEKLTDEELTLLGDIEYFLIEISGKIHQVKNMLDHDLFGFSLDLYYKVKAKAKTGDKEAQKKLEKMKATFNESLKGETIMIWN